jgi:hypothetical protein
MKLTVFVAVVSIGTGAGVAGRAHAQVMQTETKYVTVDGEVIRYEPGQVIVIRGTDAKEVSYTLAPSVVVPSDVKVGRKVTLYTEPGANGGTQLVQRVTTTSVTAAGDVKRTTEDTRVHPSGVTTKTTTTKITGKVAAYDEGKTLTITKADGSKATYLIQSTSKVPTDLVVGKTVAILPVTTSSESREPVVETITYVTETVPVP